LNGAAARLALPGDLVIVMSFAVYDDWEAQQHVPRVVLVDAQNRVVRPQLRAES
jgi:aspartate 1-decarboxylase